MLDAHRFFRGQEEFGAIDGEENFTPLADLAGAPREKTWEASLNR